ncbi:hypothetical protein MBLNU459_g5497t1 [Dothideomycetes sp. NU459]
MLHIPVLLFAITAPALSALVLEQQPILGHGTQKTDLIYELQKAEIIPTVIDAFSPTVALSIFWENATAELGNTIAPSRVQSAPAIEFLAVSPAARSSSSSSSSSSSKRGMQYTLALTDPDAPSRDNPEWSQICHWIATGIPFSGAEDGIALASGGDAEGVTEIMPYKPPGPPPRTGKHRYVFVALAPRNGTSERLQLSKPKDRQHWGYGKERQGLRTWAAENGLEVVGANFIYSQNDKQ